MSTKAAAYGQRFDFAFLIKVVRRNAASIVLRPRRNPNCSSPRILLSSATVVIIPHIRTVISLRRLEGIVIGRYWLACNEFPPCNVIIRNKLWLSRDKLKIVLSWDWKEDEDENLINKFTLYELMMELELNSVCIC